MYEKQFNLVVKGMDLGPDCLTLLLADQLSCMTVGQLSISQFLHL